MAPSQENIQAKKGEEYAVTGAAVLGVSRCILYDRIWDQNKSTEEVSPS